ncbi:MAG: uracil-DNA glycosylase [Candidatus Marinimicrobia bacterium]|nr:uracil-DNA glycosylase [Candidatus Neomarinimicrobiota bacterium]
MQEKLPFLEYMRDVYGREIFSSPKKHPLEDYYEEIHTCQKCALAKTRNYFVFGAGNPDADILFVGEAPGEQEDKTGVPFIGRAGKLLDKVLLETGLSRKDIFITNVLKCRPPKNRDPLPEEIAMCENYLHHQIKLIKPNVIVALGRIAANTLLRESNALKDMRGIIYSYQNTDLRVTYHPAAILRNMGMYDLLKGDMTEIVQKYGR